MSFTLPQDVNKCLMSYVFNFIQIHDIERVYIKLIDSKNLWDPMI